MTIKERRELLRALADELEIEAHAIINQTRFLYVDEQRTRLARAAWRQRLELTNQAVGLARAAYLIEHELGAGIPVPGERGGRKRSPQPSPPATYPEPRLRQEFQ